MSIPTRLEIGIVQQLYRAGGTTLRWRMNELNGGNEIMFDQFIEAARLCHEQANAYSQGWNAARVQAAKICGDFAESFDDAPREAESMAAHLGRAAVECMVNILNMKPETE